VTAAAAQLGLHPSTLVYRLRCQGIARPLVPAPAPDQHPPEAALTMELRRLRMQAHRLTTTYLPTPARAAMLRENDLAQRAILAKLRGTMGDRPMFGGVRGGQAPGVMRPGWELRF
jgi:hypothetical protein